MIDKYYTPSIEEFHIGFEYEDRQFRPVLTSMGIAKKRIFGPVTLDTIKPFWQIGKDIEDGDIRVKYLDKEDIESLGWKRDKLRAFQLSKQLYYKNNLILFYNADKNELSIITRDLSLSEEFLRTNIDPDYVHKIIIKNKSELKKLLKQLNIKEE